MCCLEEAPKKKVEKPKPKVKPKVKIGKEIKK